MTPDAPMPQARGTRLRAERLRHRVAALLEGAQFQMAGDPPWDLLVRNPRVFARIPAQS